MRGRTVVARAGVTCVAGMLALAGCAGSSGPAVSSAVESASGAPMTAAPVVEDEVAADAAQDNAFAFSAPTVDGGTFDGLSIDNTDVVLWFWAPWCPTCQLQSKTINEALPRMPEGVPMIGIAGLSDDLEYMREFVEVTGVTGMTHVADLEGDLYRRFDIVNQSTLVFIDDTGDATLLGPDATADEIVARAEDLAAS